LSNLDSEKALHVLGVSAVLEKIRDGEIGSISIDSDSRLMILTHSALLTADLYTGNLNGDSDSNPAEDPLFFMLKNVQAAYDNSREGIDNKLIPIYLKDVTIKPLSNTQETTKLPFLCLYSDQIVGITFGSVALDQFED
jgi:hypothetical protein